MTRFKEIFITGVIFLLLFSAMAYCDTWTPTKNLSNNAGGSVVPAIAVDGSNIYVVWEDGSGNPEIYFKKSVDGGATWTPNKKITNNVGNSDAPAIAVDGSNIYVVWHDYTPGNAEIYFKKSVDGGATWTTSKRITNNAGTSEASAIAVDGSNIYVVWHDNTPGNFEIYFMKSLDGGATWTTRRLTNNAGYSWNPAIAVDVSNVYVIWQDYTPGNYEIYFKKSNDGGVTWTTNKRLTWNASFSEAPAIAVGGLNIYIVWEDYTPGNYEIYFKKSVDGGATWTTNKRLTWNASFSEAAVIAVDVSNAYVIWQDNTPGNWEIYFKKGVLD